LEAVEGAFGSEINYSILVKVYEADSEPDTRYSLAECIDYHAVKINGHPNPAHVSTSHVERQNLTMRMGSAASIHFLHYNFARIHKTLRVTPAMAAGVSDHVWSLEEIISLAN
jgi:hypothetical protein